MSAKNKVLVVGAGLAGSSIARVIAEEGIKVDLIEKRNHIAGNAFDYLNEKGERIHKYGPHLLHGDINSKAVRFLSRFTEWVPYEHKVRALLPNNQTTPLPVNITTLEDIYNIKLEDESKANNFLEEIRENKLIPTNSDELFLASVGEKITNILFRPYTKKMWGVDPKELSIKVGARLSVRKSRDERYFEDTFQALPKEGYTSMVGNMLKHKNINIELKKEFNKEIEKNYDHCFLCLPIDVYFDNQYGKLPYRSIIFENKLKNDSFQNEPVINFTDNSRYTRVTKWKCFPNCKLAKCKDYTFTYEIPCPIEDNPGEYYYPIHTNKSKKMYMKYAKLAKSKKNIVFCGRTGLFKYIDMIPAVMIHIKIAENYLKNRN
tara:strand:+ start:3872 stop:4999 length:1128 start_codon:yes stop_codon:yes gene_type:complete